jgi:hypothetical protein
MARISRRGARPVGTQAAGLDVVRALWGKVYHTWASGRDYRRGPAWLYWPVTGEPPFTLPPDAKLPPEMTGAAR